jgi:hypothetical protein
MSSGIELHAGASVWARFAIVLHAITGKKKNALAGCRKKHRSPFESLRANGAELETIDRFPFVLSLSKHSEPFSATC